MRGLVLIVVLGFAAIVASGCGSSLGQPDGGAQGTAGTGGAGGEPGTGGAGGDAGSGGTIAGEILRGCPDTPPDGSCDAAQGGLACVYPTSTCVCDPNLSWRCDQCPTAQPNANAGCSLVDGRVSPSCQYGKVTCSCGNFASPASPWACGICPAARPQEGVACGNTVVKCPYGDDTCRCDGGSWTCATAACPMDPTDVSSLAFGACTTFSSYTCAYPELDQHCNCGEGDRDIKSFSRCSCPAKAPVDGSACFWPADPCSYDNVDCTCEAGQWNCKTNPCPPSRPAAGSACSSVVNCTYNGVIVCSCDGTAWAPC